MTIARETLTPARRVLAIASLVAMIAGCSGTAPSSSASATAAQATSAQSPASSQSASSQAPVTVTIWGWWAERMKIFEDAAADFTAANPNITIKVQNFSDVELWPKVFASVPAGTGPTLLKQETNNYFKLRDQGLIVEMPADVFPDAWLREKYPTHDWDTFGRFVYPEGIQPAILTYNKKLFADAGLDPNTPPKSWVEFFSAAEKLTVRDSKGTIKQAGVQFDDWFPTLNPLFQQGGSLVKRDGDTVTANFDTPENEKAFQFFVDAANRYKVWDPTFPYFSDAIGNQLAAMSVGASWVYGTWKSDFPDTFKDLGFAAPPTPTGDASPYYGHKNSVLGLAVMAKRPPEETAAGIKFLEYLVKDRLDTQLALDQIAGLVPARVELATGPDATNDPLISLGAKLVEKEYDAVDVPEVLNKLIADTLNRILQENMSVKDSLVQGQTDMQSLIDSGDLKYLH